MTLYHLYTQQPGEQAQLHLEGDITAVLVRKSSLASRGIESWFQPADPDATPLCDADSFSASVHPSLSCRAISLEVGERLERDRNALAAELAACVPLLEEMVGGYVKMQESALRHAPDLASAFTAQIDTIQNSIITAKATLAKVRAV